MDMYMGGMQSRSQNYGDELRVELSSWFPVLLFFLVSPASAMITYLVFASLNRDGQARWQRVIRDK